ncbi:Uncharacterized protein FWK35_00028806, partial [Aphis craccivora]
FLEIIWILIITAALSYPLSHFRSLCNSQITTTNPSNGKEVVNATTSEPYSSSILGVYYSFPTAPHWLLSNLKNIFIAALFNLKDLKKLGNDKVFYNLINLENNGVELKFSDKCVKLYFSIGLIGGDNLGVNTIRMQYDMIFYFINHFRQITFVVWTIVVQVFLPLRLLAHVSKNELKLTRINENSIFNTINTFHIVEIYSVDLMYDIFEGICIYNKCHIILNLIKAGFFSFETLKSRKQGFDYGESEVVGGFVPQNDPVWRFFINFIEIIDLLLLLKSFKQLKAYTKNINLRINVSISLGIKFSINFSELICNLDINTYTFYIPMSVAFPIYSSKYCRIRRLLERIPKIKSDLVFFKSFIKSTNLAALSENMYCRSRRNCV